MNLLTVEVELDQGRVIPKGGGTLPEHADALLTLLPKQSSGPRRNPLERDPTLPRIVYYEDPTAPLAEDEWPEESR